MVYRFWVAGIAAVHRTFNPVRQVRLLRDPPWSKERCRSGSSARIGNAMVLTGHAGSNPALSAKYALDA